MLIKRPIYNQKLNCVALELMADKQFAQINEKSAKTFHDLLINSETHLPIFVPFALRHMIEQTETPIEKPIILNLEANAIDTEYDKSEVESSPYSIAIKINDLKQLVWINFAEYVAVSGAIDKDDAHKIVKVSQAKQRKIIAYDIEKPQDFQQCKALGMDYYCGDFLFQPDMTKKESLSANKFNLLELIRLLHQESPELNGICRLVKSDPLLTYQLLKLANSAFYAGLQPVESIEQAISRLGLIHLKKWATVFSMKNISEKPMEVIESGLIRGFMASQIVGQQPNLNPQEAYTAGLLSVLDTVLDQPMSEIVEEIQISNTIKSALLEKEGDLTDVLALVTAYEAGSFDKIQEVAYNQMDLSEVYIHALGQVSELNHSAR